MSTKGMVKSAIADEKAGAKDYSRLSKQKGLKPSEKRSIRGIRKDELRHKNKLSKIYKRLSAR